MNRSSNCANERMTVDKTGKLRFKSSSFWHDDWLLMCKYVDVEVNRPHNLVEVNLPHNLTFSNKTNGKIPFQVDCILGRLSDIYYFNYLYSIN